MELKVDQIGLVTISLKKRSCHPVSPTLAFNVQPKSSYHLTLEKTKVRVMMPLERIERKERGRSDGH